MSKKRPSLLTKAKNVAREAVQAAKYLKQEGHILVDEEERQERLNICAGCEEYSKFAEDECGECGCPVSTRKAFLASTCCPLKMWDGDLDKTELCSNEES
jgi:hypothetical protein